jgi:hypothetical protein
MGQQQLLLLVLSTVIVGLATVAGIQAFDEGQTQAAQDALTQRGLSIGTDITAALNQPSQLGGISTNSSPEQIAAAAGLDDTNGSGEGITATGAGSNADCDITGNSDSAITLICSSSGSGKTNESDDGSDPQTATISIDEDGASITSINGTNLGSI